MAALSVNDDIWKKKASVFLWETLYLNTVITFSCLVTWAAPSSVELSYTELHNIIERESRKNKSIIYTLY